MDTFGRVDIVVNNAGILRDVIFHKMSPKDWLDVIGVHLNGSASSSAAPPPRQFRAQQSGAYVHMTSTSGLVGNFGQANYSAAKLGITALSKSIALDMQRYNVRSNCIAPFAWSRMTSSIPAETPEQQARVAKLQQMTPDKNAPMAVFLASDAAAAFNGPGVRHPLQRDHADEPEPPAAQRAPRRRLDAGAHRGARCPRTARQLDPARPQPGCIQLGPRLDSEKPSPCWERVGEGPSAPEGNQPMDHPLLPRDDHAEIREEVRKLCARFPGEYWRKLDEVRGYPTEFVTALTEAGYLSVLIPEEYGGSGLGISAAAAILETVQAEGCNGACLPRADVHRWAPSCGTARPEQKQQLSAEDRHRGVALAGVRRDGAGQRHGHDQPCAPRRGATRRGLRGQRPEDLDQPGGTL